LIPLDQIDSKRIDIFGTGMPRKGDLKADDSLQMLDNSAVKIERNTDQDSIMKFGTIENDDNINMLSKELEC